jgi:hypothetical protein
MTSGEVASLLQSRYQDVCPSVNFWGLAAAACNDKKKVPPCGAELCCITYTTTGRADAVFDSSL